LYASFRHIISILSGYVHDIQNLYIVICTMNIHMSDICMLIQEIC